MPKICKAFYLDDDVVKISKSLLGKYIFTRIPDISSSEKTSLPIITGGIIVETEAYAGIEDRASHAYDNRRTKRTETMYHNGGVAYIYLCYGMHAMLNIVTNKRNIPHAILIRAIQPTHGIEEMIKRRGIKKVDKRLTSGPGLLSKALGLDVSFDCTTLTGRTIWLETRCSASTNTTIQIVTTPRIGIDYAGKDAKKLLRFTIKDNPWCSK